MATRVFTIAGGLIGGWRVLSQHACVGPPLELVPFVNVLNGDLSAAEAAWQLKGVTSNDRYVERGEKLELTSRQEGLGRHEATKAALIPIRKSSDWWLLTQDERRTVFEGCSMHIRIGMKYLPAIARRLLHCRDLAEPQPFDFLTWFEYRPSEEPMFEDLLSDLRSSEEWTYVEREVDIRLAREASPSPST